MRAKRLIVILKGGLGNQLFQVGFGFYLQKYYNYTCTFACSSYFLDFKRNPEIFQIIPDLNRASLVTDLFSLPYVSRRLVRLPLINSHVLSDYIDPSSGDFGVASGYFQDYKYTKNVVPYLKNWINSETNLANKKFISVHVRRTDFLKSEILRAEYNWLLKHYYLDAIELASKSTGIGCVGVVSDDPIGAISDLYSVLSPKLEIKLFNASGGSAAKDFSTLANSKFMISSNSTFSWWAARVRTEQFSLPSVWLERESRGCSSKYDLRIPNAIII